MYKILFNSDNKGITFMSMDKNDNNVNVEKIMNGLSDGTLKIYEPLPGGEDQVQITVVDGDAIYLSIAAASIVGKEAHDDMIREFCKENPECSEKYSLLSSKGYGTAKHIEGLRIHGSHEQHRQSYIYKYVKNAFTDIKALEPKVSYVKQEVKHDTQTRCLIQV